MTPRARPVFVTGTDTGVGKTLVTLALMCRLQALGVTVAGMKPVAAGCRRTRGGLRNEDAERIAAQASAPYEYAAVNPVALEPAMAPHLAADAAGVSLSVDRLRHACQAMAARCERLVIEGAGGWLVPLNARETLADLAVALDAEVVLVVGVRLGCLNHALLSAESIAARGASLLGWVANGADPSDPVTAGNVEALAERIPSPCLGVVPRLARPEPSGAASYLAPADRWLAPGK